MLFIWKMADFWREPRTMKKKINPWIEMSVEYANQRNYLDDLFAVYPNNTGRY